jgi:hypothetical protein
MYMQMVRTFVGMSEQQPERISEFVWIQAEMWVAAWAWL